MQTQNPHTNRQLQANGQTLAYIELHPELQSKGTLLLIHGNLSAYTWWYELISHLEERHIVALDLRGYGRSSLNHPITSLEDFSVDIRQFCLKKNLKNLTVVGWSLGGVVAMKFAEIAPELVAHVLLVCSGGHLGVTAKEADGTEVKTMEQVKANVKHQMFSSIIQNKDRVKMRSIFDMVLFKGLEHLTDQRKNQLIDTAFQQRIYMEAIYAIANPNIDLSKTKAHSWTIVYGSEDVVTPKSNIEPTIIELQKLGHKLATVQYGNAGHMIPIQMPGKLATLIKEIL